MGIGVAQLEHLLHLKQKYPHVFRGEILQLGRQDTYFGIDFFHERAQAFGISLAPAPLETRPNPWMNDEETVADTYLFRALGFDLVSSMDYVDNESPTFVHDLNLPVPEALRQRFDVVLDGGTIEHVFDTGSVFRNIHTMLKPGATVIHDAPTNNFVDHGFWQISPTALLDAYLANGYERLEMFAIKMTIEQMRTGPFVRFSYNPEQFAQRSIGGHGAEMLMTFAAFQKPAEHRAWGIPQQGFYMRHWEKKEN